MKIIISNEELRNILSAQPPAFPKYTTQLLNLANQNAQGTRPKVVGQLSDLMQQFDGRTLEEWEAWYLQRHPHAIDAATKKIAEMLKNFKDALSQIDQDLIKKWVRDLVIVQTFIGLRCQEAILQKVAEARGVSYRLATSEEEAQGIDGYIGDAPVSIKPHTYDVKAALPEMIKVRIIRYRKIKSGIEVEFE
ncbi:MAG: MjaI family restriction endonuclease [Abditibacteriales bacterium]|nr:MjaI family restriction endonuclease [Abditibacteriales bacterium]MDW8366814.1 MjaI family restriction endonuclease [Abditibacteriales bacterium]